MDVEAIRAWLNLQAVLRGLEQLVALDEEAAALVRSWKVTIQFSVKQGPAAYLAFSDGVCTHGRGTASQSNVSLFFLNSAHLNRMFAGTGMPIPLKGFSRLGFMQREFSQLTGRLEHFLKPADGALDDPEFRRVNTLLSLHVALYAAGELAALEPTCIRTAARTPDGVVELCVLPDGPALHVVYQSGRPTVHTGPAAHPAARMTFENLEVAGDVLRGSLDSFQAIAAGKVKLRGFIPLIDNTGLILDRVEAHLK